MANADDSTDRYVVNKNCPDKDKGLCGYDYMKRYVGEQIAKTQQKEATLWIKIGTAVLPFVVAFFVWASNITTDVKVIQERQNSIQEIKEDIKALSAEVVKIRIELSARSNNE